MGVQGLNNRGLQFSTALISMVAVSMLIIAFGIIISGQANVYSSGATSELSSLNRLDELSSSVGGQRSSVSPNNADANDDAEAATFSGAFGVLTNIFSTFDIFIGSDGVLTQVTNQFGIPDYVRQGIITFIIISIVFALIAVIFRLSKGTT